VFWLAALLTPVTPDPAPDQKPSTEPKTYKLGEAIAVADGVTVTITGKRYTYYGNLPDMVNPGEAYNGENFGFIGLTVNVKNEGDKHFDIDSMNFTLMQDDYKAAKVQYPMNAKAYGVRNNHIIHQTTADVLEYLTSHFVGDENPPMDMFHSENSLEGGYDVGAAGTELGAVLGFMTNPNEAEGTATLQYVVGSKVYKINF